MSSIVNNYSEKLIDGKALSQRILAEIKEKIAINHYHPRLAAIIIGNDKGCYTYQRMKEKKSIEVGIRYSLYAFQNPPEQEKVKKQIQQQNNDPDINGIMVQLPLLANYDENTILELITPEKDVDGLNYQNLGRSYYNSNVFVPCAAEAILRMLKEYHIKLEGKKAVVLGRGRLLGSPVAQLLEKENAYVVKIHRIVDKEHVRQELGTADVIISATGQPGLIKAENLKKGVVCIDCANTAREREFTDDIFELASFFSTVPGGVGPMTIAVLLSNTLKAYEQQIGVS